LPIAVRGHVQKRRESLPFNSRVDTIAFDAAEELPGDMIGFFEPTTGHVAAIVYSVAAEIDVVAVAGAP